jgi:hypothetical protein
MAQVAPDGFERRIRGKVSQVFSAANMATALAGERSYASGLALHLNSWKSIPCANDGLST